MAPIEESRLIGEGNRTISAAIIVLSAFFVLLATIIGCGVCRRKRKDNEGGSAASNIVDDITLLPPPSPPRSPPSEQRKMTMVRGEVNNVKAKPTEIKPAHEKPKRGIVERKLTTAAKQCQSPSMRGDDSVTARSSSMSASLSVTSASAWCQRPNTDVERNAHPPVIEPRLHRRQGADDRGGGRDNSDDTLFQRRDWVLSKTPVRYYQPPLHYGISERDKAYRTISDFNLGFEKPFVGEEPVLRSKSISIAHRAATAETNREETEENDIVRSRSMAQG